MRASLVPSLIFLALVACTSDPTTVTTIGGDSGTLVDAGKHLDAAKLPDAVADRFVAHDAGADAPALIDAGVDAESPAFTISALPTVLTLAEGTSGREGVTLTPEFGFVGAVVLTATGLPTGVTAAPTTLASGSTSITLPLTVAANAPVGTTTVTITGTSGALSATTTFQLVIVAASGTLDPTFGTKGIVDLPIDGYVSSLIIQPDGKMIAAVTLSLGDDAPTEIAVFRFNADGTADTTFGTAGTVAPPVPMGGTSTTGSAALVLDSDGTIYVGGQGTNGETNEGVIVALNADGSLKTTFAAGGILFTNACSLSFTQVNALALDATGRLVASSSGASADGMSDSLACVSRFTSAGAIDTTFGTAGSIKLGAAGSTTGFGPVAVLGTGNIVGVEYTIDDGSPIVAFDPNGVLFAGFGAGTDTTLFGVAPAGDLFTADNNLFGGEEIGQIDLQHVLANGTLDSAYGTGGTEIFAAPGTASVAAAGMIVLSTGKLVVAGSINDDAFLIRFESDGSVDTSFGTNGYTDTPVGPITNVGGVALDANGNYIVFGSTQPDFSDPSDHIFFARYLK